MRQAAHHTKFVRRRGAVFEIGDNFHVVRHIRRAHLPRVRIAPLRHGDARQSVDARRWTDPAQRRLVPDAHVLHIHAAQRLLMPPVQRPIRVGEAGRRAPRFQADEVANVALGDQVLNHPIHFKCQRRGHDLRHQIGMRLRRLEHGVRFRRVHCHARFALHVLARFESGASHFAVRVGPGANQHRVDAIVSEQGAPIVVHMRNAEFVGDALRRLAAAVGDADDLPPLGRPAGPEYAACAYCGPRQSGPP